MHSFVLPFWICHKVTVTSTYIRTGPVTESTSHGGQPAAGCGVPSLLLGFVCRVLLLLAWVATDSSHTVAGTVGLTALLTLFKNYWLGVTRGPTLQPFFIFFPYLHAGESGVCVRVMCRVCVLWMCVARVPPLEVRCMMSGR